jgi:hypothetical protein
MRVLYTPAVRNLSFLLTLVTLAGCAGGYDSNNDSVADDLGSVLDVDSNGDPDLYDINRDGMLDGIGVDTDGDSIADALAMDLNKDGFYEAISTGKDPMTGQDQITRSQLVPLPAPVYSVGQNPQQP